MSHHQILAPPPTVEDTIDNIALIPYNRSESALSFERWQEEPQRELPPFLPYPPPSAAGAPSPDSSTEAVIHIVRLQFQQLLCKGKAPIRSQGPTLSNTEFQGLRRQLQHLQQEKEATLAQLQKLQNQQAVNTRLLQPTATNVRNKADTSTAYQAQSFSSLSHQLDKITKILNINFKRMDKDPKKSFYKQNLMCNTIET